VAGTGCAGGLTGVGLIAAFAAGLTFFGDVRRAGAFFAGFFLTFLVFQRVVASVGKIFLRFALVLPLAFFLVAIYSLPGVCRRTTSIPRPARSSSGDHRVRSFMLVHAAYCVDITFDRNFQNPFSATHNDTIEIMAIDRIELKRLQRGSNSSHLSCGERDQIRIAAHEAEEFSVCRHRRDIG